MNIYTCAVCKTKKWVDDVGLIAAETCECGGDMLIGEQSHQTAEVSPSNSSGLLSGVTVEEMQKVYIAAWNLVNGYSHEYVGLSKNATEAWEELGILIPDAT